MLTLETQQNIFIKNSQGLFKKNGPPFLFVFFLTPLEKRTGLFIHVFGLFSSFIQTGLNEA